MGIVQMNGLTLVVDCIPPKQRQHHSTCVSITVQMSASQCRCQHHTVDATSHSTVRIYNCWLASRGRAQLAYATVTDLVVGSSEAPPDILVIQYLNLKAEVLLQVLDDHDQERQLDAQGLGWVSRAGNVCCADVAAHNLQHARLNVAVSDTLDVTIAHCSPHVGSVMGVLVCTFVTQSHPNLRHVGLLTLLVPNLQRLAAYAVQDRQKA